MNKKIGIILICFLLIITTLSPLTSSLKISKIANLDSDTDEEILRYIEETEDKVLIADLIISDLHVKYWEHVVNDIFVKNDSILLHLDPEDGDIIKYKISWTDIGSLDYEIDTFEPDNYLEKQLVIFPDEDDCTFFYTFYNSQEFPVVCWEVWHSDGSTIMYSLDGEIIGYAIPKPSEGFSLSGYNWIPPYPEDCYKPWRENADKWFKNWCSSTVSLSLPTKETVSSYVQDPSVELFYELAHGSYQNFLLTKSYERYYFSTARDDMENRQPMKFAFIGSCGGMDETGENSFSHSFRKGQMKNTVTVGYYKMTDKAWQYSMQWQEYMFEQMDSGKTIFESYNLARAEYPQFAYVVAFVGDENLKITTKARTDISQIALHPLFLQFLENFPLLTRLFWSLGFP